SANGKIRR
ncbi:diguanylate cyclase domain protein, partial [Vibrio parahaemolyticus EKP-008]